VTSPRDEIDDWLGGDVQPLYPPEGSLDQIRRRARHRKTRQVVFAASGCAVVLAAAVAVPQLVGGGQPSGHNPPIAVGSTPSTVQPSTSNSATGSSVGPAATSSAPVQFRQHSLLSTSTSGTLPPPHFRPTSVTFVGTNDGTGNVVGAVIGQAGPPCASAYCTSLAGTSAYGSSWYGVSAPYAAGPNGGAGVSQLRFANLRDGWAFGPALYETSGGGWPWHQESTFGQRVIDVEAAGGHALAVFASCTGTGPSYATSCTSFELYTSVAGSRTWTQVTVPSGSLSTGLASSASLVIAKTTGYLLTPAGAVLTGPVSGGTWQLAGKAPCAPGQAQATGLPSQAQLAASPTQLLLACATGGAGATGPTGGASGISASSQTSVYTSANGSTWQLAGTVSHPGAATSLATGMLGQAVLATSAGIYYSADGGKTWRTASFAGAAPASGFSYVGMTNQAQGVAVPADARLGEIFVTRDSGKTWTASPITG
jgi:hypothetical protein